MRWGLLFALILSGCTGHRLTGYDLGASAGQTLYDGEAATKAATFAGVSVKAHFDVTK